VGVRDNRLSARAFPWVVIAVLLATLAVGTASNLYRNPQPELVAEGIPGRTSITQVDLPATRPDLVRDALSDLQALTMPGGGPLAGWDGPWRYVWPRDASFVAAAWCAVGRHDQAAGVFSYLDRVRPRATVSGGAAGELAAAVKAPPAGRWAARYVGDGSAPVDDGRQPQADGSGWVLWSAFFCSANRPEMLDQMWPMLQETADQIAGELGADGLPPTSSDYWERPESELTLGTVAPLLSGLRSAVDIARRTGHPADAIRWSAAADRLAAALDATFGGRRGYPRTPAGGADAIVTALGPPFAPARPEVVAAIERSHRLLTLPNGGVTPGQDWRADGVAWTPQTALFGLSAAARGDRRTAESVLAWLDEHRTATGALPEKVNREGRPAGEAPLGWTSALVVLTAAALDGPLPVPAG